LNGKLANFKEDFGMGSSVSKVEKKVPSNRAKSSLSSVKTRKLEQKSSAAKPSAKRAPAVKAAAKNRPATRAKSAAPTKKNTAKAAAVKQKRAVAPKPRSSKKLSAKSTAVKPTKNLKPVKKAAKPKAEAKASPAKTAPSTVKTATRHAAPKPAPRQPSRDEAAALAAFERAHKEFARGRFNEARLLFQNLIEKHAGVAEVTARARTYLAIAESRLQAPTISLRDADDLYDRGVIELNRGAFVEAQEMFERALKGNPEGAHIHYGLAAAQARLGATEAALRSLERAFAIQPFLRSRAQHDPDLAPLRASPEFEELVNVVRA
jgi:tetratricopeptide (TPR) repeat protein